MSHYEQNILTNQHSQQHIQLGIKQKNKTWRLNHFFGLAQEIQSNFSFLKFVLVGMLLLQHTLLKSQIGNDSQGARASALGGYNVTLSDVWSTNNNQAGLGFAKDLMGGIYYENRFLLSETSYKSGAFVLPIKTGAFGLNIGSFGYQLFTETKVGLSYGQRFGTKFSVGVQLNYLSTSLANNYARNDALTGAVGVVAKLNKELTLGIHIYNPSRSKLADYNNERIPTLMKMGFSYRFSEKVVVGASTAKDIDFDATLNVGVEYHITTAFYLRGGISTNPTQYAFGIGIQLESFKIDLSSSFHQTLGTTPSISIIYERKSTTKKFNP